VTLLSKVWTQGARRVQTIHTTHQSVWPNKSLVNPKSTSNQSSKPCTALQYPSRKGCKLRILRILCTHTLFLTTEWRRLIRCLKLQVFFRKRATNYRVLLWKMTFKDKASYGILYRHTSNDTYIHRYTWCITIHTYHFYLSMYQYTCMYTLQIRIYITYIYVGGCCRSKLWTASSSWVSWICCVVIYWLGFLYLQNYTLCVLPSKISASSSSSKSWELRLVGSLKWQVSFVEYRLFYRALLQKRPINVDEKFELRILRILRNQLCNMYPAYYLGWLRLVCSCRISSHL